MGVTIVFAAALYPWVTDDDISNLPKNPFERFVSLVYFSVTTFTSTGYGDITPKSTKARVAITIYMAVAFSIVIAYTLQSKK
jgi:CBS domain containing-hemolysin-like protein